MSVIDLSVGKKVLAANGLPAASSVRLPEIKPETFNEYMKSLPTRNPGDIISRLQTENPALLVLVQHLQSRINETCQANANAKGEGPGLLDASGHTVAKKVIGLKRDDATSMAAEIVYLTYGLLDEQHRKNEAAKQAARPSLLIT